MQIHVRFLPELVQPADLDGAVAVILDVLRASTTIIEALANGAAEVRPFLSVDEARAFAASQPPGSVLFGGERGGTRIDGFDLGNSPAEYTPEVVRGKTIAITTTNGTKALAACHGAKRVLVGAAVNLTATVEAISAAERIALVCGGTDESMTREDILIAGAIVNACIGCANTANQPHPTLDDAAAVSLAAWREVAARATASGQPLSATLAREFEDTLGGRNLIALGYQSDLARAAALDRHSIVPELNLNEWCVRIVGSECDSDR